MSAPWQVLLDLQSRPVVSGLAAAFRFLLGPLALDPDRLDQFRWDGRQGIADPNLRLLRRWLRGRRLRRSRGGAVLYGCDGSLIGFGPGSGGRCCFGRSGRQTGRLRSRRRSLRRGSSRSRCGFGRGGLLGPGLGRWWRRYGSCYCRGRASRRHGRGRRRFRALAHRCRGRDAGPSWRRRGRGLRRIRVYSARMIPSGLNGCSGIFRAGRLNAGLGLGIIRSRSLRRGMSDCRGR